MSTCAGEAYSKTIAQFHPWLVRKTVGVAVYAVPSREYLLKSFEMTEEEGVWVAWGGGGGRVWVLFV